MNTVNSEHKKNYDELRKTINSDKFNLKDESINVLHIADKLNKYQCAAKYLPRNMFVLLAMSYENLISRILHKIYTRDLSLLSKERKYDVVEILNFRSVDNIKNKLIEDQIITFTYKSISDQFKYIKNTFHFDVIPDNNEMKFFKTAFVLRNAIIHNDCKINHKVIEDFHKINQHIFDKLKIGDEINLSPELFFDYGYVIMVVGIKVACSFIFKYGSSEIDKILSHLNIFCYDFIESESYDIAIEILSYILSLYKKRDSTISLMLLINLAQSYKWSERNEELKKILSKIDWDSKTDPFKLAYYTLIDDLQNVEKCMKKLGDKNKIVNKEAYSSWTLFKRVRESSEFLTTFNEIFKEPYSVKPSKQQ